MMLYKVLVSKSLVEIPAGCYHLKESFSVVSFVPHNAAVCYFAVYRVCKPLRGDSMHPQYCARVKR